MHNARAGRHRRRRPGRAYAGPAPSALSARVLGVGCWAGGVAKPNTQHPTPKTLLGNALAEPGKSLAFCQQTWYDSYYISARVPNTRGMAPPGSSSLSPTGVDPNGMHARQTQDTSG